MEQPIFVMIDDGAFFDTLFRFIFRRSLIACLNKI